MSSIVPTAAQPPCLTAYGIPRIVVPWIKLLRFQPANTELVLRSSDGFARYDTLYVLRRKEREPDKEKFLIGKKIHPAKVPKISSAAENLSAEILSDRIISERFYEVRHTVRAEEIHYFFCKKPLFQWRKLFRGFFSKKIAPFNFVPPQMIDPVDFRPPRTKKLKEDQNLREKDIS